MFKKTKRKIVLTIMLILVVLFIGMLTVIYIFSYRETTEKNKNMLRENARLYSLNGGIYNDDAPPQFDRKNDPEFDETPEYRLSSFYFVAIGLNGDIIVTDNQRNVYTDEEINEKALSVYEKKDVSGKIDNLIYYMENKGDYTLVAFMDNRIINNGFSTLFKYTLLFGIMTIIILLFLSILLADKIVRPLEESYIKQKQFISDAGHELKTPISVVNANAELLSREIGGNTWLSNIQYENDRMGALVARMLELTHMENTEPQMESVDFSHLVRGEALPFESLIYEKKMTFVMDIAENIRVSGNAIQLKQVTAILMDNAVSHALPESEIRLELKKQRNNAVLSVINDGDEIPESEQKKIFDRFYRADASRGGEDNHYGLGLSIAKSIVSAHHGKISVRCYEGKVEFSVSIPREK